MIQIFYGIESKYRNVTRICVNFIDSELKLRIPLTDVARSQLFGDPLPNIQKHVLVQIDDKPTIIDAQLEASIQLTPEQVQQMRQQFPDKSTWQSISDPSERLAAIQLANTFVHHPYGPRMEEGPEQWMVSRYLPPTATVLELGANIGRNTLTIASMLQDDRRFVTLETCSQYIPYLELNREVNGFHFQIENAALSYRKLIQKDWDTIPSDTVLPGYFPVNTITYEQLLQKYGLTFDAIVADCEGALYYILQDCPQILDPVQTIIMENDYHQIEHKEFVDNILSEKGFLRTYRQSGGWGPCQYFFFEVWQRITQPN